MKTATSPSRHAVLFILVTVLIDALGFGIIIPVLPELIVDLAGTDLSGAARYGGWLTMLYALVQFFCAPLLGNLSDRFGRRPVLLGSLFAFGVDYALMGFAPTILWLFVGRFVAGIAGATMATANAYVADVTGPEKRAQSFGMIGAAWGTGFILGPVIGGLLGEVGPRAPFFVAAGLALVNVLYGLFVLPESLSPADRRPFSLRRAHPFGALRSVGHYPMIFGLFGAVALYQFAHDANPSTWTYSNMLRFGWSERDVGFSLGFVGATVAIVPGMIPQPGSVCSLAMGRAVGARLRPQIRIDDTALAGSLAYRGSGRPYLFAAVSDHAACSRSCLDTAWASRRVETPSFISNDTRS